MTDCLFCKIVHGEISAHKVFENDHLIAFLDIHPINPGHILLVPRAHYENLLGTPDEVLADLMTHVKRVGQAAMDAVGASAFNLGVNTGVAAGQVVMHTHVHVMPRFPNDGHEHWQKKTLSDAQMEEVAGKITKLLSL